MKLHRTIVAIFSVCILLLNDPRILHSCTMQREVCKFSAEIQAKTAEASDELHLIYVLNNGTNHTDNPDVLRTENLPFVLNVPKREGYNFAGWYTDSSYSSRITQINQKNASAMVLFAKWTRIIDNQRNVEMYSYCSSSKLDQNQKELRKCAYRFLDELEIPGMPETRENDYRNNMICSVGQYFQGLAFTEELVLLTAYTEETEIPGSLLLFERSSGEYLATLGMKNDSHLGGITYDGENIWVCHSNSGTLERISYEYIQMIANAAPKNYVDASELITEYSVRNKPSCITFFGGCIWVATYDRAFHTKLVSYRYHKSSDQLLCSGEHNLPSKVQGIAFDENGAVYLSTSYGRNNSSYLKIYDSLLALDTWTDDPAFKVEMPPCSEEIVIQDRHLYVLFESASWKYFEGTDGYGTSLAPLDKLLEIEVASLR